MFQEQKYSKLGSMSDNFSFRSGSALISFCTSFRVLYAESPSSHGYVVQKDNKTLMAFMEKQHNHLWHWVRNQLKSDL